MYDLTQKEYIRELNESINKHTELAIKKIIEDDIWPHTVPFMLAKTEATMKILAYHNVGGETEISNFDKKFFKKGWRKMGIAWFLYKTRLFKTRKAIRLLSKVTRIGVKIKPTRYLKMDGLKFYIDKRDKSMIKIFRDYQIIVKNPAIKIWEPETTKIVKDNVKPGDVCLDIGCSVGYFTLQFSRLVGKTGKVFSFEPTTNQVPYTKHNIDKNGYRDRVRLFNVGAWDKTDKQLLPLNAAIKYKSNCVAVDDVLYDLGIKQVDFIKIDVDGPEIKVLKGLIGTIERSPNLKMIIEYYPEFIRNAGGDPQEFMDIINKYFNYIKVPGDYSDGCWNFFCTKK